jgi:Ca-activated chloride channel homolog
MILMMRGLFAFILLLSFLPGPAVVAAERAIIVLDASGSMWGQIDGKPKLQIARETLRTVLQNAPDDLELGLMAYGHRERGNCDDIELIVPPGPRTTAAITQAVDRMKFLGKTPLSAAVKQAAEALRYTEDKATVILITDGLENCNADPCALGTELEQAGMNFTVHVVGFDLTAEEGQQVACLAENTGGQYFQAANADALAVALTKTVVAVPTEAPVTFVAVDQNGKPIALPLSFQITSSATGAVTTLEGTGEARADLGAGDYQVAVSGPNLAGGAEFSVADPPEAMTVEAPVEISTAQVTPTASVTLSAPATIEIGRTFQVVWAGPAAVQDDVQIFDPAARAGEGAVVRSQRLRHDRGFEERTASLVAPATPGNYLLRYWNGTDRRVLATRPLTVE